MNIFRDEEFSFTMYKTKTKACYLSQPYFWEQQSYVERLFPKFRERKQNKTSLTRISTYNQNNAVVLLRY